MSNQRIIKFRAWQKHEKRMFDVWTLVWSADGTLKEMDLVSLDEHHQERTVYGNETILNNYNLLQFTGLLDKDGNEIYEGDIVAIKGLGNAEVVMNEGQWETYREDCPERGGSLYGWLCPPLVIGNIWQHPHLLTEEHQS